MKTPHHRSIEPLEPRIAPATLTINAATKTATWTDWDGDLVTMKWTSTAAPNFGPRTVGDGQIIDLVTLSAAFHQNVGLTITVKTAGGGDGFVDLGRLSASGVAIKSLSAPKATFAELDAGDGGKAITTLSLYALGTTPVGQFTNASGNGSSDLNGVFSSFKLAGDFGSGTLTLGKAGAASGSISIGGNIRGDSASTASTYNGYVGILGSTLSSFTLGGSLIGGDSLTDGSIVFGNKVSTVTIKGSLIGGEGTLSGQLALDQAGTVKIAGSVVGGGGTFAGSLTVNKVTSFSLGGSLIGGSAVTAGLIDLGTFGTATITGNIQGGSSDFTGRLGAVGGKSMTIGGSVLGGLDNGSGYVNVGDTKSFTLKGGIFGHEATAGTSAGAAAVVRIGDATSVSILGGIHAGHFRSGTPLLYNGALILEGNTGTVTIKGGITGNTEVNAYLLAEGQAVKPGDVFAIKSLNITGDVSYATIAMGHLLSTTAAIGNAENPDAALGSLTVKGNWHHSSFYAGINDVGNNGANLSDSRSVNDPARIARVGTIAISGRVLADPLAPGYSGFIAEKIAKITVGGATVFKTGDSLDFLDPIGSILVREL